MVGGTLAATMVALPLRAVGNIFKILKNVFVGEDFDYSGTIDEIVEKAQKSRKDGLLSLEADLPNMREGFFKNRKISTNKIYDIAKNLIPKSEGGLIEYEGQVEVISSIDLDKKDIQNDLRWGVYIVIKAQNQYVKNCFKDYGMVTDSSGNYSAIWRPYSRVSFNH